MPNSHLISKLKDALEEIEVKIIRRRDMIRFETHAPTKPMRCVAFYDGDAKPLPLIEVAVKGKGPEEIVVSVIHELCHHVGLDEAIVQDGLEQVAYTSRALREAVGLRLIRAALKL